MADKTAEKAASEAPNPATPNPATPNPATPNPATPNPATPNLVTPNPAASAPAPDTKMGAPEAAVEKTEAPNTTQVQEINTSDKVGVPKAADAPAPTPTTVATKKGDEKTKDGSKSSSEATTASDAASTASDKIAKTGEIKTCQDRKVASNDKDGAALTAATKGSAMKPAEKNVSKDDSVHASDKLSVSGKAAAEKDAVSEDVSKASSEDTITAVGGKGTLEKKSDTGEAKKNGHEKSVEVKDTLVSSAEDSSSGAEVKSEATAKTEDSANIGAAEEASLEDVTKTASSSTSSDKVKDNSAKDGAVADTAAVNSEPINLLKIVEATAKTEDDAKDADVAQVVVESKQNGSSKVELAEKKSSAKAKKKVEFKSAEGVSIVKVSGKPQDVKKAEPDTKASDSSQGAGSRASLEVLASGPSRDMDLASNEKDADNITPVKAAKGLDSTADEATVGDAAGADDDSESGKVRCWNLWNSLSAKKHMNSRKKVSIKPADDVDGSSDGDDDKEAKNVKSADADENEKA